ncbi:MAG: TonB-dependent copper receptor [Sideroxyarcus sp.]
MKLKMSVVAVALTFASGAFAEEMAVLDEVVVTAPKSIEPLTVKTNPKKPRQPVPAHDGADYLKTIPGFSVIRKGGTDGDPVFRGMAGSRINVLMNGENIMGGCGGRMDPPTAYVFPAAYDSITVLKGPQSVIHGAGGSAATVMFDQINNRAESGFHGDAALTVGSFGRHDEVLSGRLGSESAYARVDATSTQADDYKDGLGNAVRSAYKRWSGNAALGWTPDENTVLQVSAAKSDGHAAYADRTMDGTKFARENVGLKFDKKHISSLVDRIEAQVYYNYIDHVMDNFTLRPFSAASYMVNNPDRKTTGGRIATTLLLGDATKATVGLDTQTNIHTLRTGMSMVMGGGSAAAANAAYLNAARTEDMNFKQTGVFGEATQALGEKDRVIAGLRVDFHEAHDSRTAAVSSTAGQTDKTTLKSYFGRYEMGRENNTGTTYVGLGHAERSPDYWERKATSVSGSTVLANSSFFTKPEKTTQLDIGASWRAGEMTTSVSAFYAKVSDYILMKWVNQQPNTAQARNINVTTMGGEADMSYRLSDAWQSNVTLAYVHATNDTDNKALAQQPPLELRLGANYDDKTFLFGALLRAVAAQNRYDVGSGNIVANGMDYGRTGGFSVFSLNGGWHASKSILITAGVDNVFNKQYNEALSRGFGTAVSGYTMPTNTRISEPGRNVWAKANIDF